MPDPEYILRAVGTTPLRTNLARPAIAVTTEKCIIMLAGCYEYMGPMADLGFPVERAPCNWYSGSILLPTFHYENQ